MRSIRRGTSLPTVVFITALAACSSVEPPKLSDCVVPLGDSPSRGPADAWVTAVEFGDFECSFCGLAEPTVRQVDSERPGIVRWIWKHLPLSSIHPRALPTAIAAECAHDQDHFWEMHDLLYAHQNAQSDADLTNYAQQIGLDMGTWQACLSTDRPRQRILADERLATTARVDETPTFFFNGIALVGAQPLSDFLALIDTAQQAAIAADVDAGNYYSTREGQGCL